ncbi:MAG: cyclic pyranopterin monophosphate synthase MoaC [Deltaproteobacteria bacterium]|nr:cyclic pyranopterin monophosphate synthase MoaC [Deltaproteobacteria bacterium]
MLFRFDEIDERLELLPIAARRALDRAGSRLSREGWLSLPVALRRQIVALGSARDVDIELVTEAMTLASPAPDDVAPVHDPDARRPPEELTAALGAERPLSEAVWSSLEPVERYALAKVASRGRPERLMAAYAEIVGHTAVSTHLAPSGGVRMVDVGEKPTTERRAVATSEIRMSPEALARLARADVPKGDVLGAARIAGILAAKRTPELIPLCHHVALTRVEVSLVLDAEGGTVLVEATAEAADRTGVEMEALVAASVAALTVYDMMKSLDRAMVIGPTRLRAKSGGRSGDFTA